MVEGMNHKGDWNNKILKHSTIEDNNVNYSKTKHTIIDIDTDIDNSSFEGHVEGHVEVHNNDENSNETVNKLKELEEQVYTIPKESMITDFNKETEDAADKSTIYEYHFEKLNKIHDIFSVLNLIWSSTTLLLGSLAIANISTQTIDSIIVVVGFLGIITTGTLTIFRYKDKIAAINKYIGRLDTTKDSLDVLIKRIQYTGISDQEYYKWLEHSRTNITHSNSSTYNINSGDYYTYYKRLKAIKELKRNINHDINLDKEEKYNEYSRKHLELMKKRLELKIKIKDIHNKAENSGITDFGDSNVFTMDTISTHEE
jgi:hypothetical protein